MKIGDTVAIKKNNIMGSFAKRHIGHTGTIVNVNTMGTFYAVRLTTRKGVHPIRGWCYEEDLRFLESNGLQLLRRIYLKEKQSE